jgi:hypothetical protein
MADIQEVPNSLAVCMGSTQPVLPSMNYQGSIGGVPQPITGSGDASGCMRPRPTGTYWGGVYPEYPRDEPTNIDGAPGGWGEMDANHSIVFDIDDHGTSGDTPMTINAYICLKALSPGSVYEGHIPNATCDKSLAPLVPSDPDYRVNGPGSYVEIDDLSIHNVMLDTFLEACSGALVCGHLAMDTRGKPFSGQFHYYDQTIQAGPLQMLLHANMSFPVGFNADYRYTRFRNQGLPPAGAYDEEWGHVSCNSDDPPSQKPVASFLALIKDPPAAAAMSIGFFDRFLCHIYDPGNTNPWYPNG